MSTYRGFHELKDGLGNEVELRERWLDPDRDIWGWFAHPVIGGQLQEALITPAKGHNLPNALREAANYLERRASDQRCAKLLATYSIDRTRLTSGEIILLNQFAKLYEQARISFDHNLYPGNDDRAALEYIRAMTRSRCNLEGSNDFAPGVRVYPTGCISVSCNGHEFTLSVLDQKLLKPYYGLLFLKARVSIGPVSPKAFMIKHKIKSLNELLKQIRAEKSAKETNNV